MSEVHRGAETLLLLSGALIGRDPSTGRAPAALPGRGPEDAASAVTSESKAFASGDWSRMRLSERRSAPEVAPRRVPAAVRSGAGQLLP